MSDFAHLIEPDILAQIEDISQVTVNRAHVLGLTHNRFDLAFKLYYLQGINDSSSSAYREHCYKQHIQAFSGIFAEPNNPEKNTYEKFKEVFDQLYLTIRTHGFDAEQSLIPLAANGSILNGAHRTAIAIFLGKPVGTVQTRLPAPPFDYRFFGRRGVPIDMLDAAAQTFAEYDDGCFLAAVWPAAKGYDHQIESILSRVVYKKCIRVNYHGAHNLLAQAYRDEPWIGPREKNFPGIKNKLAACFPDFGNVRIYLFQADSQQQVQAGKKMVRDIFNLGNHAIHITNNQEETVRLGQLLFNRNGLHFLNHGWPHRFFKGSSANPGDHAATATHNSTRLAPADELTMEAYGLRQAVGTMEAEIDARPTAAEADQQGQNRPCPGSPGSHSEVMDNPQHCFVYEGTRLISLKQVYAMKLSRKSQQDIADLKLIGPLVRESFLKNQWASLCQWASYRRFIIGVRARRLASRALRKVGLLDAVKKLLRQFSRSP